MTSALVTFPHQHILVADIEAITPIYDNCGSVLTYCDETPRGRQMRALADWEVKPSVFCWFEVKVRGLPQPPLYWDSTPVPALLKEELQRRQVKYAGLAHMPAFLEFLADELEYQYLVMLDPLRRDLATEAFALSDKLHLEWHQALQPKMGVVIPL